MVKGMQLGRTFSLAAFRAAGILELMTQNGFELSQRSTSPRRAPRLAQIIKHWLEPPLDNTVEKCLVSPGDCPYGGRRIHAAVGFSGSIND